ncbi:uncharacterized protein LOC143452590 [Clavelina lepadiformis]|uniref:Uncharacterized protein n=1 Tax=Clavelina lepadiformis TaxID=159417 RepID=A0ABP0FQD4_CLALP
MNFTLLLILAVFCSQCCTSDAFSWLSRSRFNSKRKELEQKVQDIRQEITKKTEQLCEVYRTIDDRRHHVNDLERRVNRNKIKIFEHSQEIKYLLARKSEVIASSGEGPTVGEMYDRAVERAKKLSKVKECVINGNTFDCLNA